MLRGIGYSVRKKRKYVVGRKEVLTPTLSLSLLRGGLSRRPLARARGRVDVHIARAAPRRCLSRFRRGFPPRPLGGSSRLSALHCVRSLRTRQYRAALVQL